MSRKRMQDTETTFCWLCKRYGGMSADCASTLAGQHVREYPKVQNCVEVVNGEALRNRLSKIPQFLAVEGSIEIN
jgi:hypothetical protein